MRVLLISPNKEEINMVTLPLGLGMVAAATRAAGHEAAVIDLLQVSDARSAIEEGIEASRPEVIGISVRNVDDQNMEAPKLLLEQAKETVALCRTCSDATIVLGGAGYSIFPESLLSYLGADMGIQGEGEVAFPILLDRMKRGTGLADVPGLYLPGSGLQGSRWYEKELDRFPPPDAYLATASPPGGVTVWMPLQTRRGCPLDCSYCSTSAIEGRFIRRRSPSSVVRDIALFLDRGFDHFYFIDSTFNLPPSHAKEICRHILESVSRIIWRCILYPARIDEELIELMARAGCMEVSLGFESGCKRILDWYRKRFGPEDVRRTSDLLVKYGIKRMGFLLLGAPGETRETVEESLAFADSLKLDALKITPGIRIYPGTLLSRIAVSEKVISPKDGRRFPRFYMPKGLEDWLRPTLESWMEERPNWMF